MKKLFTLIVLSIFLNGYFYAQDYINEDFNTDIPSDWTTSSEGNAYPWFWNNGTGAQTLNGTGYARVDADAAGSANNLIENLDTPGFDASGGNIVIVQFDQYYNEFIDQDTAYVQVWNGSEWQTAWQSCCNDIGGWNNPVNTTVIITDYINTASGEDTKVRFRYDDGDTYAWYWAIDNVIIKSVDCLEPQNLTVSELGAISAQAVWDSGSGTSDIAYGPSGFDITDIVATGGTLVNTASSPYLISGLSPETAYQFYVRDDCGANGFSGWSGPFTFTTTIGCPAPVFNGFSNPTGNSIDISFTQGVGDVYVIYGPDNFVVGNAGDTAGVAVSTYTLSGLDALTFYDVYLYMDCTGDGFEYSTLIGPYSFNTLVDGPGTDCENPIILNGNLPFEQTDQSICGYGNNITTSPCTNYQGYEEIVFAFSPESDSVTLGVYGSNSTTESSVYFNITNLCPTDDNATCVASGFLPWNGDNFLLTADLENGETYYITISGYTGIGCTLDLQIFEIECSSPTQLSYIAGVDGTSLSWVSSSGASNFQVEWGLEGFAPGTGNVIDGEYGVDGPPILIDGLSDQENYAFFVTDICGIGQTSLAAGPGFFTGPPPANDLCADAIEIDCGDVVTGNTANATTQGNQTGFCGTSVDGAGIWYTFTGTGDDVVLSLCGSDYDTKIHLYSGTCGALTCVGGNDDNFAECGPGNNSYLYASTEEGITYYVFVSGWLGYTGTFSLEYSCITCPLINGLTVQVTDVSANVNWNTTNVGAEYVIEYGPSGFVQGNGTTVTGTVGTDGPPVGIDGLTAGNTYDIYVYENCGPGDSNATLSGSFTTNLLPPPANDLCSGAIELSCGDLDSGSTVYATQIGNPAGSLCGFATLNSNAVWYQITGNGQLATLSTCGSNFDTELFVFTGSCDNLSCYISADGNPGVCEWGSSQLDFLAEDGVTYYVAVAGWSAFYTGDYYISYECNPCGDPNNINISTTDVSAEVSWNSYLPGSDFTLVYGDVGFDWADGTVITGNNASDLPVELTGLLANQSYQVCIFEYCEAEMSNTDTICTIWTTNAFPPPSNDAACNAIDLVNGETMATTNQYASTQIGEPIPPNSGCATTTGWCNSTLTSSTWYTYTTDSAGVLTVTTCLEGSYDTQLAVYQVGDCSDFSTYTLLGANDDAIGGCSAAIFASTISMCVEAGVTYYIQVDPYGTAGQSFNIQAFFTAAGIENLTADPSYTTSTIDWIYTGPTDVEFSIIYLNTETNDSDTVFGNTADLPVILIGLDPDVNYEYTVYCDDVCGTSTGPNNFTTQSNTGINELSFGENVRIYPNPVNDKLTLEINANLERGSVISLLSIHGQVLYQKTIADESSDYRSEIDVSNFARGVYLIKIQNGKSSIQERVIIQ